MAQKIELGLGTFGDVTARPDGQSLPQAQVIRDVVEEASLADDVGVYAIGLGEHHQGMALSLAGGASGAASDQAGDTH
jgi:hypothetical protein